MRRFHRFTLIVAVLLLTLVVAPAALAQEGDPPPGDGTVTDDDVNDIAQQLYCPVCENVPLDVCPTQACADWRGEIRTMLENGRGVDDIKTYFVDRYGRRVLATPEPIGLDLVVWVLPIVGVVIGAVVLVAALRRMAPEVTASVAPDTSISYDDLDAEYVARLEAEFREFTTT